MRILITKTPPGFADEHIREAWVGVELSVKPHNKNSGTWSGNQNAGGYIVSGSDAVQALLDAGKTEAARYWSNPAPPPSLRFGQEYCEIVSK